MTDLMNQGCFDTVNEIWNISKSSTSCSIFGVSLFVLAEFPVPSWLNFGGLHKCLPWTCWGYQHGPPWTWCFAAVLQVRPSRMFCNSCIAFINAVSFFFVSLLKWTILKCDIIERLKLLKWHGRSNLFLKKGRWNCARGFKRAVSMPWKRKSRVA